MQPQFISIELPPHLAKLFAKLAQATQTPVEQLALESLLYNLPPLPEDSSSELEPMLLRMFKLDNDQLTQVAQTQMGEAHYQRFGDLLQAYRDGIITPPEQSELEQLRLKADQLMQRRKYAQALLRWRGQPLPTPPAAT
ncbi:MAG: hypothetical protein HC824_07295 [Synechococcales cyanobacterium RM1_1_8]|nr:hypothetical protein [Synechococcales cyanobacterium RM1_1_8]